MLNFKNIINPYLKNISHKLDQLNQYFLAHKIYVYLIILVLLFVKETKQFVVPQFWAEDGAIFFSQAVMLRWQSLFTPYAGYIHLYPHLIADFAVYFAHAYAPMIYAYAAILPVMLLVNRILSPRLNLPYQAYLALMLIAIPCFGEVFMSLACTIYLLGIGLVIYVLYTPAQTRRQKWLDVGVILFLGLSGPYIFCAYPIFLWRFIKDKRTWVWLVAASFACLLQILLAHLIVQTALSHAAFINTAWLESFGGRFFASLFYYKFFHHFYHGILISLLAVLLPFILAFYFVPQTYRQVASILVYFWLIDVIAMLLRIGDYVIGPNDNSGDRYLYLPTLMIAWLLILSLKNKGIKFVISLILLLMMLVQSACMFPDSLKNKHSMVDYHWQAQSQKIIPGHPIRIPINPQGWYVHLYGG